MAGKKNSVRQKTARPAQHKKSAKNPKDREIERLRTLIKEKDREIKFLTEISKTMSSASLIDEIMNRVVSLTAQMLGTTICSIMLLNREKEELNIIATQSLSSEYRTKGAVRVGFSISGRAVKEKRPVAIADVREEPGYMFKDIARREGYVSMLAVPMMTRGTVVGVINVYTNKFHVFDGAEIDALQAVAGQSAMRIENMSLEKEASEAKQALETRKIIDRAKGLLMKKFDISEDEAYRTIHKKSMDSRKSMKEIAEAVIIGIELGGK